MMRGGPAPTVPAGSGGTHYPAAHGGMGTHYEVTLTRTRTLTLTLTRTLTLTLTLTLALTLAVTRRPRGVQRGARGGGGPAQPRPLGRHPQGAHRLLI